MREIKKDIKPLVSDGKFNFGTYNKPLKNINPLESKISKLPFPKVIKNIRLKEWNAFQLGNDRFFIFIAIMDIKKIVQFIINIYDKYENKSYQYEKKITPWSIKIPNSLYNSNLIYKSSSINIEIKNELNKDFLKLQFNINKNEDLPNIVGSFTALTEGTQPMVAAIPFNNYNGMYSHKRNCIMEGNLIIGDNSYEFEKDKSFFIIDEQKGYYPYIMKWDWVTASYYNDEGDLIGFNLTKNQSLDEEIYNENCIWINENIYLLPPVKFYRDEGTWYIYDLDDVVNLSFNPIIENRINKNILFVHSKYNGPFGLFNGHVKLTDRKVIIKEVFGMGENFYLRS